MRFGECSRSEWGAVSESFKRVHFSFWKKGIFADVRETENPPFREKVQQPTDSFRNRVPALSGTES